MTKEQTLNTNQLLNAGREGPRAATPTAPALPAAGLVQLFDRDERHLEIRYYDVAEAYRSWLLPREDALDLVRWWVEQGVHQTPQNEMLREQKVGRVFLSLLSHSQVYCRGSNPLGSPKVTGYQFPRAVVESLAVYLRLVQNRHPQAATENLGGAP